MEVQNKNLWGKQRELQSKQLIELKNETMIIFVLHVLHV